MIELIFLASLRERVRRQQAEARTLAAEPARFVPMNDTVAAPPIIPTRPTPGEREWKPTQTTAPAE
jgi:hypothetical protein